MIDRLQLPSVLSEVRVKLHPGAQLLLRLNLHNQSSETFLVRPLLDDWVTDDDRIFSTINPVDPAYIYLFPANQVQGDPSNGCQIMTIQMPLELRSGQILKNCLRFPGLLEEGISIIVEIQAKTPETPETLEYSVDVTFPLQQLDDRTPMLSYDQTTTGIFGLMSGLIDLDRIPVRWLVAELLVMVSQNGAEYAQSQAGRQLLLRIQQTRFFQDTVTALIAAKVPSWICETLSMSEQVIQRDRQEERLLYIWERWLLSLVESDVEAPETNKLIAAPLFLATELATKLGTDSDRWLGNFLLGLAVFSPRIAVTLEHICANAGEMSSASSQPGSQQVSIASYHLATGLPGLDILPVRWLVLELLLIFARKGDEYSKTESGKELRDRLRRTRFCKNGVLSLSTAQAARWISVSHATATAFHVSMGSSGGQMGLLKFWEQWLWNIADPNILVPQNSMKELVKKLGMDAEAWFLNILLGLSLLSPRISTSLEAIASTAPLAPPEPPTPTVRIKDILGEAGSLQR